MALPDLSALNPALLGTFLEVAERGGVLPASRQIHLSQPAVTARIRQLEEALGVQLFLRSVHGMELTPAGRRLCLHARRVRALLREAAHDVAATVAPDSLSIAASTTIAAHVLPPLLARFQRKHPVPAIEVSVENTEQVLARVRDGLVPLGLVEGKGRAQAVRLLPLLVDEILPVYAPQIDDPGLLARIRQVRTPADLIGLPVIWREAGSGTRNVVEHALASAGIGRDALRHRIILGGTESIKNAVLAGIGIAFLSRCTIEQEVASGRLAPIPVRGFRIERTFRWALPGGGLSGTAALFFSFVQREIPPPPRLTPGAMK